MKQSEKDELTLNIHDALDNLSTIAEMDSNGLDPIGVVKNHKFVIRDEDFSYKTIDWLTEQNAPEILNNIKQTFKAILRYLKEVYEEEMTDWSDVNTRRGIQSIMVLVGEAANNLNKYIAVYKDVKEVHDVTDCREYKDLQEFYLNKIAKKFPEGLEGDKAWQREWQRDKQNIALDLDDRGLKDFETVKKDQEYELFYLRDDEEKPFFNRSLIRNIKLFCDFDESMGVDLLDDPLMHIHTLQDKDYQATASQILSQIKPYLGRLFREKKDYPTNELASYLYQSIMALMLASNPNNLLENTLGKSSFQYFEDFQYLLRKALVSDTYQYLLAYQEEEKNYQFRYLMDLIHEICKALFYNRGGIKEEMIGFIFRMMRKGAEKKGETTTNEGSFWNRLLQDDDNLRSLLKLYPNGPLFKDLDILRVEEEEIIAFEPLLQGNIPSKLFSINNKVDVIRMPCPTKQQIISKVQINPEFKGFLRFHTKDEKHLLINFQDRNSWKEYARSNLLEKIQNDAEFTNSLFVITLSKDSPFYYQKEEFFILNNADEFIEQFKQQLFSKDNGGYYFPSHIMQKYLKEFIEDALLFVHKCFFSNRNMLSRKDRLDFIEIFYQVISIKIMIEEDVDTLTFLCKDSIDKGAVHAGGFYGFLKLLCEKKLSKEDENNLMWLFYSSALLIRERSVDTQRLNRIISFLSCMENAILTNYKKISSETSKLFGKKFLSNLKIN